MDKKLKIALITILGFFALSFVMLLGLNIYQVNKIKVIPSPNLSATPLRGILTIESLSGTNFLKDETFDLLVTADSKNAEILGYDLDLNFDNNILVFDHFENLEPDKFDLYTTEKDNDLFATGIKKTDVSSSIVFTNTPLVKLFFKSKNTGKTEIDLVFKPQSKRDSNLINESSQDILDKVNKLTITITKEINLTINKSVTYQDLSLKLVEVSIPKSGCVDCITYAKVEVEKNNQSKELVFKTGGIAGLSETNFMIFDHTLFLNDIQFDHIALGVL